MVDIKMSMDDPEKRALAGLKDQRAPGVDGRLNNPFFNASEMDKAGDRKGAERIYLELLNADFDNPVVMAALGMNYAVAEKNGLARLLLQGALDRFDHLVEGFKRLGIIPKSERSTDLALFINAKKSEILNALGTCYKHENKTDIARSYFEDAQKDIPINPDIQNNIATLYINEGKPELALDYLNKALEVQADHPQAKWNRSLANLELGNYKEGWAEYGFGVDAKVRLDRNYGRAPIPHWDGTPGKKLVVYGEQGIGDEIMFASMLPDLLKDCPDVVFECHKKLHRLFSSSFPNIPIFPTREDEIITWPLKNDGSMRYQFDAKVSIGDLGRFYRNRLSDFPSAPYIRPTVEAQERWAKELEKLPRKPNIGISWVGGHKRTRVEVRSIELEALLPILSQDANWISLQYTPCEDEIKKLKDKHGIEIHHWPDAVYSPDYNDTAGLVGNLDLVITVCTSLVHLAGSMGMPVWVMTPSRPAWRYRLDLEYMPWYGHSTLFRQEHGTVDWSPVIAEVAGTLADLLSTINAK